MDKEEREKRKKTNTIHIKNTPAPAESQLVREQSLRTDPCQIPSFATHPNGLSFLFSFFFIFFFFLLYSSTSSSFLHLLTYTVSFIHLSPTGDSNHPSCTMHAFQCSNAPGGEKGKMSQCQHKCVLQRPSSIQLNHEVWTECIFMRG